MHIINLKSLNSCKKGFTLIEMVTVIAVIGVLAALGVGFYLRNEKNDIQQQVTTVFQAIETAKSAALRLRECVHLTVNSGQISFRHYPPNADLDCQGSPSFSPLTEVYNLHPDLILSGIPSGGLTFLPRGGLSIRENVYIELEFKNERRTIKIMPAIGLVRIL